MEFGIHLCEECLKTYSKDTLKDKQQECEITKTYFLCFHRWSEKMKTIVYDREIRSSKFVSTTKI